MHFVETRVRDDGRGTTPRGLIEPGRIDSKTHGTNNEFRPVQFLIKLVERYGRLVDDGPWFSFKKGQNTLPDGAAVYKFRLFVVI
tara:strand:+ start:1990 stop:2244 length:255 start_codon:yes stop_codon:yes gene_type:complete